MGPLVSRPFPSGEMGLRPLLLVRRRQGLSTGPHRSPCRGCARPGGSAGRAARRDVRGDETQTRAEPEAARGGREAVCLGSSCGRACLCSATFTQAAQGSATHWATRPGGTGGQAPWGTLRQHTAPPLRQGTPEPGVTKPGDGWSASSHGPGLQAHAQMKGQSGGLHPKLPSLLPPPQARQAANFSAVESFQRVLSEV